MNSMKGKIHAKIVKLRDLSAYTTKVIEDAEAELLQFFNQKNCDMTRYGRVDITFEKIAILAFLSMKMMI